MKLEKYTIIFLLLIVFVFLSCEENKFSQFDIDLQPPILKNLQLDKYTINTDTIRINNQFSINDTITIINGIFVKAYDPNGFNDIRDIKFLVFSEVDNKLVNDGILYPLILIPHINENEFIEFQGTISFKIIRKVVGLFKVIVIGSDKSGNQSNMLSTTFSLIRTGKPPIISELRAPDSVSLPNLGSKVIQMSVRATDENNDIKEVYFRSLDSSDPNRKFFLYDSGNLNMHGDSLANDGIYSILIELPYNMTPKSYRFEFEAKDFTELLSNKILHTIIVTKQ